ncbi:recombinase family protein [Bacillus sp. COPE52]|uniref:recombinase family protein n=1 Tax=Bacillus sp. COPE52 TaxID=2233998 RepID=UPI000E103597|nr:recombinase family protein [Bacillus sp. COPE52]AXK19164.1 recombinase family protein [Bacillus sp. COPE52]
MRCAIYRRVSTDEQAEKGFSLENQKLRLESFATSQGWEVSDDYVDDGFSGKNMDRPALRRMFNDVDNFDVILVYKLDRFTRSVKDLNEMLETIKEHNIAFKSATESIDTTTATGRMILNMMGTTAQWERETISERIKDVFGKMRENGIFSTGHPPYGYKCGGNKSIEIVEERAKAVRYIFEQSKTKGLLKISLELNRMGVKTRRNNKFSESTVKRILHNPFYCGYMTVNDKWVPIKNEGYMPIISEEEFKTTQKILTKRNNKQTKSRSVSYYPFSGIVLCPDCQRTMIGDRAKYGDYYYRYYRCVYGRASNNCTNKKRIRAEQVDKAFAEYISESFENATIKLDSRDIKSDIEHELKRLDSKIDRLSDLYIEGDITKSKYNEKMNLLLNDKEKLERDLTSCKENVSVEFVQDQIKQLESVWHLIDDKTKSESIRSVFDTIKIKKEKNQVIIIEHTLL